MWVWPGDSEYSKEKPLKVLTRNRVLRAEWQVPDLLRQQGFPEKAVLSLDLKDKQKRTREHGRLMCEGPMGEGRIMVFSGKERPVRLKLRELTHREAPGVGGRAF